MPISYNQIIKASQEFQEAHYFLKSFGNGQAFDITLHDQTATQKYPLMWMEDLPMQIEQGVEVFAFRVFFIATVANLKDRTNESELDLMSSNVNEVKSDMMQCAKDYISYWVQSKTYSDLSLDKTANRVTIEDKFIDRVTGCYIEVKFRQAFNYNSCSIPMSGVTPPPDVCAPVLIYENDILVDTVESGGIYSYTTTGGSIDTLFNGSDVTDSTSPLAIQVVNTEDTPVGALLTDTSSTKKVEVGGTEITTNGGASMVQSIAEGGLTILVQDTDGDSVGTVITDTSTDKLFQIADSVVSNSDDTYSVSVLAENNLELPDTDYEVYLDAVLVDSFSFPTLKDDTVTINVY